MCVLYQVAIVTGGGQGLGEGVARMLSDNGAAVVVIFDLDEEKGQSVAKSLRKGLYCKVDVSSEDSVKAGFQKVRETCGRVDIMVNSAGIVGPNGIKTEDVETSSFDKVYEGTTTSKKLYAYSITADLCILCS